MEPLETVLTQIIDEQKRAEEDKASKNILKKITKALQDAFHHLPQEEYSWLQINPGKKLQIVKTEKAALSNNDELIEADPVFMAKEIISNPDQEQKEFFEIPGSLYSAIISPSSVIIGTGDTKTLKIIARDRKKLQLDSGYSVKWYIDEGERFIDNPDKEFIQFKAPDGTNDRTTDVYEEKFIVFIIN